MAAPRRGERIGRLMVVRTVAALRQQVGLWHRAGDRVGLVPTMGALHPGHLALVARARELADRVVASLFVNPTQFGPNEDFSRYPRDEMGDAAKFAAAGTDLLYAPAAAEIYPPGFATMVLPGPLVEGQDGRFRPGHFPGVATVVTKLLLQCAPEVACFGEKDWQQLQVIRRIARDLDIPCRIEGVTTVREADGLALSSRNAYLSPAERQVAPALHRALAEAARRIADGADPAAVGAALPAAIAAAGFARVDYAEVLDAETLRPLADRARAGRILAAAWLGRTRLIDNEPVAPATPPAA